MMFSTWPITSSEKHASQSQEKQIKSSQMIVRIACFRVYELHSHWVRLDTHRFHWESLSLTRDQLWNDKRDHEGRMSLNVFGGEASAFLKLIQTKCVVISLLENYLFNFTVRRLRNWISIFRKCTNSDIKARLESITTGSKPRGGHDHSCSMWTQSTELHWAQNEKNYQDRGWLIISFVTKFWQYKMFTAGNPING